MGMFDSAADKILGRLNVQYYAILDELKTIRDHLGELLEVVKEARDALQRRQEKGRQKGKR